ncbi:MAG: alpha/beta hydrolase [Lapillicoccus sp.]
MTGSSAGRATDRAHPFDPQVARTTLGPVEYAVLGRGAPVIVLHGSPGGIDAAEVMSRFLPRDEVAAVLLSRPGYLGTPLSGRETTDDQADLVVALMDELGLQRAGLLAWSGGGPLGYRMAVRHPGRVTSLVAFAALSGAYRIPPVSLPEQLLLTTSAGEWLLRVLATHQPRHFISGALAAEGTLTRRQLAQRVDEVFADEDKRAFVLDLGPTVGRGGARRDGFRNDLNQFAAIDSLGLESIAVRTLVVHGDADADVGLAHGRYAAERVPGAELLVLETGTHLALWTHPDAASAQARALAVLLGH